MELAESFRPDIAFMDIQMPGHQWDPGHERKYRKTTRTLFLLLFLLMINSAMQKKQLILGVLEYLTKPVNKRVVIDVCMKAMRKWTKHRQKRSDDLEIREKLETVVPILESGYLYNILLCRQLS